MRDHRAEINRLRRRLEGATWKRGGAASTLGTVLPNFAECAWSRSLVGAMIEGSARHWMESRVSRLWVFGGATMLALLAGASGCAPAAPPPVASQASVGSPPAAQSWPVEVGTESPDHAVQMLQFYPAAIMVNVGDTIAWSNPTTEL